MSKDEPRSGGQEARNALDATRGKQEPVERAAQILADAIDRLTVALTGTDAEYDNGALGNIGSALHDMAAQEAGYDTTRGAIDRIADAIDTFDVKVGGAKVGKKSEPAKPSATVIGKPKRRST